MKVVGLVRRCLQWQNTALQHSRDPYLPLVSESVPRHLDKFQNIFTSPEIQHWVKGFEKRQARSPPILMHRMHPSNNAIKCSGSKFLIKPQGPEDSRIQEDEAWELTWWRGTSPADLMCSWRGAMKSSQLSLWLILPWQRGSHLVLPKNYSKNRKKLPSLEDNSIPLNITWAKCSCDSWF